MMLFDNNDNDVDVNADDDNSPFVCMSTSECVCVPCTYSLSITLIPSRCSLLAAQSFVCSYFI